MMMWMMVVLMISLISSLAIASNPLTMGLTILLIALTLTMTFATAMSSWYAFLIFLIYVGGMLVMFAYFMALMPNQELSISISLIMMTVASISLISMKMLNPSTMEMDQMTTLYILKNGTVLIILAMALLYAMIIVVKLTSVSKGPLRPFMFVKSKSY